MNQMQGLQQHYSGMNGVKATVLRGIILPSSNTSVSSSSCSSVLGSVHSILHGDGICSFTHADLQVSCQQVFYPAFLFIRLHWFSHVEFQLIYLWSTKSNFCRCRLSSSSSLLSHLNGNFRTDKELKGMNVLSLGTHSHRPADAVFCL